MAHFLLLQTGDHVLLETGDKAILEFSGAQGNVVPITEVAANNANTPIPVVASADEGAGIIPVRVGDPANEVCVPVVIVESNNPNGYTPIVYKW